MACRPERSIAIGDLVAGRLGADEAAEVLDHVEACAECSRELDLVAGLVAAAESRGPQAFVPRAESSRPWWVLAAAAAAIVALGLLAWRRIDAEQGRRALVELASLEPVAVPDAVLRGEDAGIDPERYRRAMELYSAGDFAAAEVQLAELLARTPGSPLIALYLGIARLQIGKASGALAPLATAAATGEGLVQERALWYQAGAKLSLGDGPGAIEILERLVSLGGDYEPNAREKLAAVRVALGR